MLVSDRDVVVLRPPLRQRDLDAARLLPGRPKPPPHQRLVSEFDRRQHQASRLAQMASSGARNEPARYTSDITYTGTADEVAKSLGVRPANLTVAPSSVAEVDIQARPQNQPIETPYSVQHLALVREAKAGGELVRFEHRGRFFAAGFAVVRNGTAVARLVTARS